SSPLIDPRRADVASSDALAVRCRWRGRHAGRDAPPRQRRHGCAKPGQTLAPPNTHAARRTHRPWTTAPEPAHRRNITVFRHEEHQYKVRRTKVERTRVTAATSAPSARLCKPLSRPAVDVCSRLRAVTRPREKGRDRR